MATPFFLGNPELYAQQLQIDRQQKLADALQQQGQQPANPDSWNSMPVVPRVGVGGLFAKIAQQLAGSAMQGGINQNKAGLYGKQMDYLTQEASPHTITQGEAQTGVGQSGMPLATNAAAGAVNSAVGTQIPSQLNPRNLDPRMVAQMLMTDAPQYLGQVQRTEFPSDSLLTASQLGVDPALLKNEAEQKARAGALPPVNSGWVMGANHQPQYIPTPPSNANAAMGPNGQVSVTPMPGSSNVAANTAFGNASGNAQGTPQAVTNPQTGQQEVHYAGASPFEGITQPPMTPNPTPQPGTPAPGMRGTIVTAPNQQQTQQRSDFNGLFTNETQSLQTRQNALNEVQQAIRLLQQPGAKAGPGTTEASQWAGVVANLFPGSKISSQAEAYQILRQRLANANSFVQQGMGGAASADAASREASRAGLPSIGDMNAPALESSARLTGAYLDAGISRTRYLQSHGASAANPDSIVGGYQQWSQKYDPDYFVGKWQANATGLPSNRTTGTVINTAKGPLRWNGSGWDPLNAPQ